MESPSWRVTRSLRLCTLGTACDRGMAPRLTGAAVAVVFGFVNECVARRLRVTDTERGRYTRTHCACDQAQCVATSGAAVRRAFGTAIRRGTGVLCHTLGMAQMSEELVRCGAIAVAAGVAVIVL